MPSGYPTDPENAALRGKKPEYNPEFHPEDLITKMSTGMIDVEIYADWDISKNTFYRWRRENPEFEEAYQQGLSKWRKEWYRKGREFMENGNREAYRYWAHIFGIKGDQEDKVEKLQNSTTVNINQLNQIQLESKSEVELKEILHNKLEKLNILPSDSLDTEFKVIKDE